MTKVTFVNKTEFCHEKVKPVHKNEFCHDKVKGVAKNHSPQGHSEFCSQI
jgi:hypothetical protein